ncbi:MAG TPA: group I intron-associated PD-(D/E)XK endonuclease [Terriglobales bacterium]|nr:group I intron-associated PD-(D/E)XK endonuclease [Terriglobales bacterium]
MSPKRQGELAELAFLHRAAALGLIVMKPFGDSAPYDIVVDNGSRLLKLQIKSAASPRNGAYEINAARGRFIKRPYTRRDIDFLAAYLIPEDTWYIFPLSAFSPRKTMRLHPNRRSSYKEAWHFLLYKLQIGN